MLKKLLELIPEESENLYQEALKQVERGTILRIITESIRNSLDIDEIRQTLVNVVGKKLNADKCFFWDYNNDKKEFIQEIKFDYVTSPEFRKPYTYGKDMDDFLIKTYKNQGYIYIEDFLELVDETGPMGIIGRHQINYHKMRTNCCFGLFDGEKFLGAFAVQYKDVTPICDEDMELLKLIVNQTIIALKQAELYSKTKKQAQREQIIREITETAIANLDAKEIQNKLVTKVTELFKPDKCFIRPFNAEIDEFMPIEEHAQYYSSPKLKKLYFFPDEMEELIKSEYKKGTAFIIPDLEEYFDNPQPIGSIARRQIKHYGIMANYCFPILIENKLIGAFVVQFIEKTYLEPEDINFLKTIVNQAAISLKQAELYAKSQEASRLKSEFITNVSHEIRTPLNSILGFSQLFENQDYPEEKHKKYLSNISLSASHLLKLVNSILDFSKIEAGKMELMPENFDSVNTIENAILSVKSMAIQKNITIKTELTDIVWKADVMKFKQILLNLLSNAIKFTPKNGQITIRTRVKGNELVIEVEDNGIGIAKEDKNKIFKYFRQINSSALHNQEGTGLGLALAKKLVELHCGTIGFESEKGKGSKFWFTIPKIKIA